MSTQGLDETFYRAIFDANGDALFVHDTDGSIVLVNDRMCAMFGCTKEQALRLGAAELSSNEAPYTPEVAMERVRTALEKGSCVFDWQSRRLDGTLFHSEVALRRFVLGDRPLLVASVRDVSERRAIEAALRESEERFAAIFRDLSSMLAFTEPDTGRLLDVNATWLETMGLPREAVIGRTGTELGLWADPSDRDRLIAIVLRGERARDETATLRMRGREFPALLSAEVLSLRGRRYVLWEVRDVSEQRRAEEERERLREQLVQAQKMESVGRLAGGIAHDFNNLLTVINGCASALLEEPDLPVSERVALLEDVQHAGTRAAALTQQLLAFSRRQIMQPRQLDLRAVISDTELLLRRVIGEDVELVVRHGGGLGTVHADPNLVHQVVMNLAINARDAMPRGGRLTIETHNEQLAPTATRSGRVHEGAYVVMSVTDTGCGMDEETQRRLFEPFFTTKPPGQGTGLGLSTVYGIVEQSGGFVDVKSAVGAGSTFSIHLPRSDAQPTTPSVHAPAVLLASGDETILLVEDQPDVRRFTARLLRRLGYAVIEAANADEAQKQIDAHPKVDLLLSDVVMPGMSGGELAAQLRRTRPALRALFMSGYSSEVVDPHLTAGDGPLLHKPFGAAELSRRLRLALGAPPAGALASEVPDRSGGAADGRARKSEPA